MIRLPFFSVLLLMMILAGSCQKEEEMTHLEDLYGDWRLTDIEINGQPAVNFGPFIPQSLLGLRETGRFYFDYNSGTWEVRGNELRLWRGDDGPIFRDYTIVHSSPDSLVLSGFLTESAFYTDFAQFDDNEPFVAKSYFSR